MSNFLSIIDKNNNSSLDEIKQFVIKAIKSQVPSFENKLSELHNCLKIDQVNEVRLKTFNMINTDLDWENLILDICETELKEKHGSDLLIQSKINLSIQMPADKPSILPIHTDSSSADSPFQTNIWIPLTDAFDTNSMFVLDEKQTMKFINDVGSKTIKDFHSSNFKINKENFVKRNERVDSGTVIAQLGNTGQKSSGPHLHFEIWKDGKPINPLSFFQDYSKKSDKLLR